jgi:hypothetical protein
MRARFLDAMAIISQNPYMTGAGRIARQPRADDGIVQRHLYD